MNNMESLKNKLATLKAEFAKHPDESIYEQIVATLEATLREQAKKLGTLNVATEYGNYPNCHISLNKYSADGSLCVELWNEEDGPIARLTTCLNDKSLKKKGENFSYLDDNNCPWAMDFIETYKLGRDTGKIVVSGYCFYPLIEWNLDEILNYA